MSRFTVLLTLVVVLAVTSVQAAEEPKGFERIVAPDAKMEKVNKDVSFKFTEGPCADTKGNLFFSDSPENRIMKLSPDGTFSVFRQESNGPNGNMFDSAGNLVGCEMRSGRVVAMGPDGSVVKVIAEKYNGKRFNSPNDLVIDRKGGIYFSDPKFGQQAEEGQDKEAVYYVKPDGTVIRVVDDVAKPNGIILSPDEKTLYVDNTAGEYVRAYDVQPDGTVTNGRDFAKLKLPETTKGPGPAQSGADGVAMDVEGNLYVTTAVGTQVINPKGELLGIIESPEHPANCDFGGSDYKTLYITARTSLYKIDLKVKGLRFPQK